MTCPLCGGNHTEVVDHISKKDLRSVYLREYQADIDSDVKGDMKLYHCKSCDLKYFHPCYTGGQKFYEDLQKFDWYYKDDKYEYEHVLPWIKSKDKVLEIGCGKGAFSNLLKTKNYTGIEFSENARNIGRFLGRNIITESIEAHAEKHPEEYDVVCSFQVVEHTTNPRSFIEGAINALKPGGTLILTTPSEDSFLEHIQDFALNMPPHHVTKWSDKCLTNLEKDFNIKCVHLVHEPLNSFHIPWFFTSMVVYQLNKTLGIKHSLIKQPRHLVSHVIAKMLYKLLGKDLPSVYQGHGHTVIAVYKKSANGHPK